MLLRQEHLLQVTVVVSLTLLAACLANPVQVGNSFPEGITLGESSAETCVNGTLQFQNSALFLCVNNAWVNVFMDAASLIAENNELRGEISSLQEQVLGIQLCNSGGSYNTSSQTCSCYDGSSSLGAYTGTTCGLCADGYSRSLSTSRCTVFDSDMARLQQVAGGSWTVVYSQLFEFQEPGPTAGLLTTPFGTPGYQEEFSLGIFDAFENSQANQMLVWMIDLNGPNNLGGYASDEIVWIRVDKINSTEFTEMWSKQIGSSNATPYGLRVTTSEGVHSTTGRINNHHHNNGVVQFSATSGSNTRVIFEYNFMLDTVNPLHHFYMWPHMNGAYGDASSVTGNRWGGISVRNVPFPGLEFDVATAGLPNLFSVKGSPWVTTYSQYFTGTETGPTPTNVLGTYGTPGFMSEFSIDTLARFSESSANQLLLWMISVVDENTASLSWIKFERISLSQATELLTKVLSVSNQLPAGLTITTSSGRFSTSAQVTSRSHTDGAVQLGISGAADQDIVASWNVASTPSATQYFNIWPDMDGTFAGDANDPVTIPRWGGFAIRSEDSDWIRLEKETAGGGWTVIDSRLLEDKEVWPTSEVLNAEQGSIGYKQEFSRHGEDIFTDLNANEILIWMIDIYGQSNPGSYGPDEVVWLRLKNVGLGDFQELFGKTPGGSNSLPNGVSIETSSGFQSNNGQVNSHSHNNGVVQFGVESGTNSGVCVEWNIGQTTGGSVNDLHHFWIWEGCNGSYAKAAPWNVQGNRWAGVAVRRFES